MNSPQPKSFTEVTEFTVASHSFAAIDFSWALDGWIILTAVLAAISTALLGNFLILRKMSLLGDAISHAVLPGLAVAFFLSNSRNSFWMFLGAVVVGFLTAVFTEWIRGAGKVDEGASMGVVFTSLFALGLVMIVQAADNVDLDPGCVLYGAIELTPLDTTRVLGIEIPRVVMTLSAVLIVNLIFVLIFFKELKLSSFDASLSTTLGFPAALMHYLLMTLVAVTAVACFESVGNILVVAMMVVPPCTAYLLTDRLGWMLVLSCFIGSLAAVLGHLSAIIVPEIWGYRSTSSAAMIAVVAGLLFIAAALLSPKHGVIIRAIRRRLLSWRILCEDILGLLYRIEEKGTDTETGAQQLSEQLLAPMWMMRATLRWLRIRGMISQRDDSSNVNLTSQGRQAGEQLIRSHRLWEYYLVTEAGVPESRIHDHAEQFEHFTGAGLNQRLSEQTDSPTIDPHGSPIPGVPDSH